MKKRLTGCILAATLAVSSNAFAQYGAIASSLYANASRGNGGAIQRIINSGYSIDTTDANGNTALCLALLYKDSYAYGYLRRFGADGRHICTRYINGNSYATTRYSGSGFEWKPAYTVGAVAILGGAGVAAALAGGGGGGGGSHHSSGGGSGGGSGDDGGSGG
ncbi:MAG: hypothetical protein Q4D11_06405, partial [Rhodospirillales bacterium]|nr:hypothetical protein [Rhodospirillales bacterium]